MNHYKNSVWLLKYDTVKIRMQQSSLCLHVVLKCPSVAQTSKVERDRRNKKKLLGETHAKFENVYNLSRKQ